jgi:hypothetical protein
VLEIQDLPRQSLLGERHRWMGDAMVLLRLAAKLFVISTMIMSVTPISRGDVD